MRLKPSSPSTCFSSANTSCSSSCCSCSSLCNCTHTSHTTPHTLTHRPCDSPATPLPQFDSQAKSLPASPCQRPSRHRRSLSLRLLLAPSELPGRESVSEEKMARDCATTSCSSRVSNCSSWPMSPSWRASSFSILSSSGGRGGEGGWVCGVDSCHAIIDARMGKMFV